MRRTVGGAKTLTLVIRPKRNQLNALKRNGHLKVRAKLTFRPKGGVARSVTRELKLVRTPR